MSYEKQTWETGEVITAEKLNHMEDGIASVGSIVLHYDSQAGHFDKTFNEVYHALENGITVVFPRFSNNIITIYTIELANSYFNQVTGYSMAESNNPVNLESGDSPDNYLTYAYDG